MAAEAVAVFLAVATAATGTESEQRLWQKQRLPASECRVGSSNTVVCCRRWPAIAGSGPVALIGLRGLVLVVPVLVHAVMAALAAAAAVVVVVWLAIAAAVAVAV